MNEAIYTFKVVAGLTVACFVLYWFLDACIKAF